MAVERIPDWLTYRLIAFIGIEEEHYTLNIVLDENWGLKLGKKAMKPKWVLFHFDSLRE
jgi:hypothetical protein